MTMIKEKRRHPRVEASVKVRFRVLRARSFNFSDDEAVSRDMGAGGLALALNSAATLGKDDMVRLEILDGEAKGLHAYAEVAWTGQDKVGLKFMGILENDLERIRGVVEARLKGIRN